MPNHVTNVVTFRGDQERVYEALKRIQKDGEEIGTIDFNKIIPMPESLDIEAGSRTDAGLKAYSEFISECLLEDRVRHVEDLRITEERERGYLKDHGEINKDDFALGKTAYNNVQMYGTPTWYEWRIQNWGTKWNSYSSEFDAENNALRFCTAWSAPHPIMERLQEMYPDLSFTHEWADEDIGNNCGRAEYFDGERFLSEYPEGECDRIEFAASILRCSPADYGLYLNASEDGYIRLDTDTYDLIDLFGKPALFSNWRLSSDDIPKGLYCYDLREADNGDRFITIEPHVVVNHGGSVITDEPIDFGEAGFISFTDETSPNFIGTAVTIEEYLKGEFNEDMDEDTENTESEGMDL